jgi:GNAT superfamily N-acetyltransferase
MGMTIDLATTDEEILSCFPVMAELRPQYSEEAFLEMVRRLMIEQRFQLAYLSDGGIKSVAGIRIGEWLATGKYLEIEDFVTAEAERSRGYGVALLDWLFRHAAQNGCGLVRLVSAVSRVDAHRFYERAGMARAAYFFTKEVPGDA